MHAIIADQRMYGLTAPDSGDKEKRRPAMKPTRFITDSVHMSHRPPLRFDGGRYHQPLTSGTCRDAMVYPLPLVQQLY